MKYSKEDSAITVFFYQNKGYLERMKISSYPSYVIVENPNRFIERGYRAKDNTSKSSGSGLGLSILQQICEFNDIKLSLSLDMDEDGKQLFVIEMVFNSDYYC